MFEALSFPALKHCLSCSKQCLALRSTAFRVRSSALPFTQTLSAIRHHKVGALLEQEAEKAKAEADGSAPLISLLL